MNHIIVTKNDTAVYGADKDDMVAILKMKSNINASGGIFEIDLDESLTVTDIFVQKPSMIDYAKLFGDFTIVDGTFNMTAYHLTLQLISNVDSLGLTTITGFSLNPSERTELQKEP